ETPKGVNKAKLVSKRNMMCFCFIFYVVYYYCICNDPAFTFSLSVQGKVQAIDLEPACPVDIIRCWQIIEAYKVGVLLIRFSVDNKVVFGIAPVGSKRNVDIICRLGA